jgi:hypothetical protein
VLKEKKNKRFLRQPGRKERKERKDERKEKGKTVESKTESGKEMKTY